MHGRIHLMKTWCVPQGWCTSLEEDISRNTISDISCQCSNVLDTVPRPVDQVLPVSPGYPTRYLTPSQTKKGRRWPLQLLLPPPQSTIHLGWPSSRFYRRRSEWPTVFFESAHWYLRRQFKQTFFNELQSVCRSESSNFHTERFHSKTANFLSHPSPSSPYKLMNTFLKLCCWRCHGTMHLPLFFWRSADALSQVHRMDRK